MAMGSEVGAARHKVLNLRKTLGFPGGISGKEPACRFRRHKRHRFDPWVGKIPWRRPWQPTPVSLPGKSHGQRRLVATVWGVTKSPTQLKRLSTHVYKEDPRFHFPLFPQISGQIQNALLVFYLRFLRDSLGEGNGNPLQYSCLANPMDGGAWWAAVHGVVKSRTLSDFTFTFHFPALEKEMATQSSVLAWRIPGTGEPLAATYGVA